MIVGGGCVLVGSFDLLPWRKEELWADGVQEICLTTCFGQNFSLHQSPETTAKISQTIPATMIGIDTRMHVAKLSLRKVHVATLSLCKVGFCAIVLLWESKVASLYALRGLS